MSRPILIVEMDQIELACRILEAFQEIKRPVGATASQALSTLQPNDKAAAMAAALAALKYLEECAKRGSATQ